MMNDVDPIALAAQIAMGIALAACAGLRAFLPPLALGVAARGGLVTLSPGFSWLGETPALVALAAAVVIELVGDKVPVVDHFLDAAGTVIRPCAGALVASVPLFAAVHNLDDGGSGSALKWAAGVFGVLVGGGTSGAVHLAKAQTRLASTPLTAGLANPVISIVEDAVSLFGVIVSILLPLIALLIVLTLATWLFVRFGRRRARPRPAIPHRP